jgi:phytoene/squalene synthetase
MLTTTEALFCVLGEIPNSVSDPSVGMVKLQWWRQELLHKPIDESAHPLVNALRETGADRHLNRALLDDYLVGLSMSIDPDPVADEVGLFEHLSSTGGLEIPLFVGVQKTHPAFPALLSHCCVCCWVLSQSKA